ncbi:DUF4252 domain-containing protein [Pseudotenacibaculum haliotis]|uniref:DUF4252 domain-containing protein n=1 Tax=Pseudotenacibaculum haliotis TaxID=1862138 RepID=A0ABW5LSD7_9FLAO
MKKVILLIALVAAPVLSYGQSIFDKLEDMDGVSSVIVSKDAFEILSKFNAESLKDNDAMEVFKMVQDLNELKVFSTDKADVAAKMETMVKSAVKGQKLTELMRLKEDKSRVFIYVKAGKNKDFVSEVLMFIKGIDKHTNGIAESVVVSLTGNIDINKLSKLADTFTKSNNVKVKVN